MHIKQSPQDFEVEEITEVKPGAGGAHVLYRMEKSGWTTPDALQLLRRRWRIHPRRLSYGGLKDRHAHTIQYLSIHGGPERNLNQQGITVEFLGKIDHPYTSRDITANRFRITVRDLTQAEAATAAAALAEVREAGVPNYFDDQRFGSVSLAGRFVARHIMLGEFEEALRLALAAPYRFDRAAQKKEKADLRRYWGDWPAAKEHLPRSHARSLVDYLVNHPHDFRGALQRLRPELRGLYLSAYQSHLWNRMLATWLEERLPAEQLTGVPLKLGVVPMQLRLSAAEREQYAALHLPLPSAKAALSADETGRALLARVLADEGLSAEQFKLKGMREMFFSRGERAALCLPAHVNGKAEPDDLHPGRLKMTLKFDLPRGSYATLIVKRITRLEVPDES
jgi:tRNA pseudouridine13 synthase